jgi:hypothetical protein
VRFLLFIYHNPLTRQELTSRLAQLSGITFGLAVASAIFVNTALARLQALLPGVSEQDIQSAIEGSAGSFLDSLSTKTRQRALEVLVDSLTKTYVGFSIRGNKFAHEADIANATLSLLVLSLAMQLPLFASFFHSFSK